MTATPGAPVRALLLDFDGLICDTENAALKSWQDFYAAHGLLFPDRLWARMAGRSDGERLALDDLSARLGRPVDGPLRAARRRLKQELCDAEPLRPGVRRLVAAAAERNLPVAVVSSSRRSWVEPHLVRLGLRADFVEVVTGELTERHKPAPDLYQLALRRLGLSAREALAFEDSVTGIRAARAAGIRVVAVPNAVGNHDDLHAADAALVLTDLTGFDLSALDSGALIPISEGRCPL